MFHLCTHSRTLDKSSFNSTSRWHPRNFESAWSRASPSYGWWFCHTSSIMQWNTHLVRSELCQRSPDAPGRNSILLYVQDLLHHLHYGFSYCFPSDFALLNKCRVSDCFWMFAMNWAGCLCTWVAGASVFSFSLRLFMNVYECLCIVFFMSPDFFEILNAHSEILIVKGFLRSGLKVLDFLRAGEWQKRCGNRSLLSGSDQDGSSFILRASDVWKKKAINFN